MSDAMLSDPRQRLAECLGHDVDRQDFSDMPGLCPRCTGSEIIGRYTIPDGVDGGRYTERCAWCGLLRGRHTIPGSASAGTGSETSP